MFCPHLAGLYGLLEIVDTFPGNLWWGTGNSRLDLGDIVDSFKDVVCVF